MSRFRDFSMKLLYFGGIGHWLKKRNQKRRAFPILLFHRVSPDPDPFWPPLHPRNFQEILSFFKKHYRFLPMADLGDKKYLPQDAAFISFDDAFQDFDEHALPILQELELPATLFVPSGSIDRGEAIWPSLVDRYVEAEWEREDPVLKLQEESFPWGTWRSFGKESCAGKLKQKLMGASYQAQLEVKEQLEGKGFSERVKPMEWTGLKNLPDSIELGAHTVDHPYLPSLDQEEDIEREMRGSKERIEAMTGRTVQSFAYPFGGYDERAVRIASKNFGRAFTTDGELVVWPKESEEFPLFHLPRIDIHDSFSKEAFLRVNDFHKKINNLFKK